MDDHIHVPMLSTSILIIISFILLFSTLPQSHCSQLPPPPQQPPPNYSICREQSYSYSCGKLSKIDFYPFWGGNNRPAYCGGGDLFQLHCQDGQNTTTILIGSQNFTVTDIHPENHTMRMKRTDLAVDVCYPQFDDTYLSPPMFRYPRSVGFDVNFITIFYDCPSDVIPTTNSTPSLCGPPQNETICYVGAEEDLLRDVSGLNRCGRHVQVPAGFDLDPYIYNSYGIVDRHGLVTGLEQGFELEYNVSEECTRCLGRQRRIRSDEERPCWNSSDTDDIHRHVQQSCHYCPDGSVSTHCSILSVNPKFEACTPRSCGNGPPIKFPFWIPYEQDSFCGYPHFEITCKDKNPVLRTSDNYDLLVKDISYSNSSFTAADIAVYENKSCPAPMYNYTLDLDQTPFTYSPQNSNLSFFYNCTTEPMDYPTYEVDCAKNATHYSFAVFHKEALEHKNYSLNECQFMVNAPLSLNATVNFTSLLRMNYIEVLKMGFLLNWRTAPDCQHCEKSGGHCGFDNNEFHTFCKEQSYSYSCGELSSNNIFYPFWGKRPTRILWRR